MKITSFKELLLKKTEGDSNLQFLIKNTKDNFFSKHILEILEKMAEDKRRPRSSNRAVQHFGDNSLDEQGDTSNMIHDALSHHASHYKAAINSNQPHLASKHMKKIHNIMHFSRKLGHDGVMDHGGGKLKIEAIDPKPWERSGFPKTHEGKIKKFVTDTKGWSRNGGSYDYMQMNPHESYSKEIEGHGHKGSYPLEEIKVNGKYLHIDDNVNAKGYQGHEFDEHPIMKNRLYSKSPQSIDDNTYDQYLKDLDEYDNSKHLDNYYDRHEKLSSEDPEGYANRGINKPDKVIKDQLKEETPTEPTEQPKSDVLSDVHKELTEEERNNPSNKKILDAIGSGLFDLDKDTIVNMIRSSGKNVKKSLDKIKNSLVKNKDFLKENPKLLKDIRDRLVKAIDDNDTEKWLKEHDPEFSEDQYGSSDDANYDYDDEDSYDESQLADLFDKPDNEEDQGFEDEDKHLVETEKPEMVDINEADKKPTVIEKPIDKKTNKGSGYTDWKPREDYTPEQQDNINNLIAEGYHPGDAEILAGADKKHLTMKDAVSHRVHPHEMSSKMHDRLKDLANIHMDNLVASEYDIAEPEFNPQKATAGSIKSYNDKMQDFRSKKKEFESSEDFKNMSPRERHKARKEWNLKYHKDNPEHYENIKSEWQKHGEIQKENTKKREQKLKEDKQAIAQAGQMDPEAAGSLSSGSQQMAIGPEQSDIAQTKQGAYQAAGISSNEEGGALIGSTIKDPHATFAEKNPQLTAKYKKVLENNLDDAGKARLKRINTLKGS